MAQLPSQSELIALMEKAGYRHSVDFRKMIQVLYLNPKEREAKQISRLAEFFSRTIRLRGTATDPFSAAPLGRALTRGPLPFAVVPNYRDIIALSREDLNHHVLVCGSTGEGKTYAAIPICLSAFRRGMRVILIDPVGQFARHLGAAFGNDFALLRAEDYFVNPFKPPAGVGEKVWWGWLANIDREVWFFKRGSETFSDRMKDEMAAQNIERNLTSFFNYVVRRKPHDKFSREYDHWETVSQVTESILRRMPQMGVRDSDLDGICAKRAIGIDCATLPDDQYRKYVISHLLAFIFAPRCNGLEHQMDTLVVIDELSEFASAELKNNNDLGTPLVERFLRTARKAGIGLLTIDQTPSKTLPATRSQSHTVICFQLRSGEDKRTIANDLGLTAEQAHFLGDLGPREAVVKLPHVRDPFLARILEVKHG